MTLAKFQVYVKVSVFLMALLVYSAATYSLGRISANDNSERVQGISTNIDDDKIDKPLPYTDIQSAKIIGSAVKLCSNTALGFEVSYPNDWFTTYNSIDNQCSFFAPYAFVIPESSKDNLTPVKIEAIDAAEWESTSKFYENPNEFSNVITIQNLDINSRSVKRIETESTGYGSTQEGLATIYYLVFDAKSPLVISYSQGKKEEDISTYQSVLQELLESLKFF